MLGAHQSDRQGAKPKQQEIGGKPQIGKQEVCGGCSNRAASIFGNFIFRINQRTWLIPGFKAEAQAEPSGQPDDR